MLNPATTHSAIAALPATLRALLEAELAAGNVITEVGHTFPAPAAGAYFLLAKPLLTRGAKQDDGLVYRSRNSSLYSGEITDARRFFFLLEPAVSPEPVPDMDALRSAALPINVGPPPPRLDAAEGYTVEVDCRGESLTYREAHRSAHVICTFMGTPQIVPRTLSNWTYLKDGHGEQMTAEEKPRILGRIADYCRKHHHMNGLTFEN